MVKLLLDENLPTSLASQFPSNILVYTVKEMGWTSMKNGDLLKELEKNQFNGLITADQNLIYQQNINRYNLTIYVVKSINNRLETLLPLLPKLIAEILSVSNDKIRFIK